MTISTHSKGVLLASIGVLVLSPDSLLIRIINVDLWTLAFLRGLFMGLSLMVVNFLFNRKAPVSTFAQIDIYALGIMLLVALGSLFFVSAIQTTSVAHTLIIIGAVPVVAAILGLLLLREKLPLNTWVTIVVVMVGLVFVVYDDQQSNLIGDMYAFLTCIFLSLNFILARRTKMKNMIILMSLSGFLMALVSFPFANLNALSIEQLSLSLFLGLMIGIAYSMMTFAPQFIQAAEVAVFLTLETVFGILLVWLFLGEYPGLIALIAGSVIILAVMLNSYLGIRSAKSLK